MQLKTLPDFEYFAPKTLREACSLLHEYKDGIKLMAGGTDLLVNMKYRTVVPRYLIGLKNLAGLDKIAFSEREGLRLGALITHQSITESTIITGRFGGLAAACSKIGTPQIRGMATLGGNVCNASPSADSLPPLIALNAVARLVGLEGERTIALEDFFMGPGKTVLRPEEILTEIQISSPPPRTGMVYVKLPARTAVDMAAVCVAVSVTLDPKSRTCHEAKIVLGAVAPTPIRARKAEEIVRGKTIEETLIEKAARMACEEACPISDVRSSARYRTEMVKVLTKQAMSQAMQQAESA